PWPTTPHPRRAAISSFGISGTNAHLILEQPPHPTPEQQPAPGPAPEHAREHEAGTALPAVLPLVVSARGERALRAQAARLGPPAAAAGTGTGTRLGPAHRDLGWSLAATRSPLTDRAVILGSDPAELLSGLAALERGEAAPHLVTGRAADGAATAFLFTGQGSQRPGMGSGLYAADPAFAAALDEVCAGLDPHLDLPLKDLLLAPADSEHAALLDRTEYTQPALFALQVALFRLLERYGAAPDHLIGHSVGELAAAHAAGVLDLSDACALVAARGRLVQSAPQGGAMAALQATEEEVLPTLAGRTGQVVIAAVNGPDAVVVSGDATAVQEVAAHWRDAGRRTKLLRVSHAFHSPHLDGVLDEFRAVAAGLAFRAPAVPVISGVTGRPATAAELADPGYWVRQLREPVRFHDGVRFLAAEGVTTWLELGPDGVLSAMVRAALAGPDGPDAPDGRRVTAVPLLRGGHDEPRTVATALARAFTDGVPVDWTRFFPGGRAVPLPTYAYQRERYWRDTPAQDRPAASDGHPLLDRAVELAGGHGWVLTGRLDPDIHPWLAEHTIQGRPLLPGAAVAEMAVHAARETGGQAAVAELTLEQPLQVAETTDLQLMVTAAREDGTHSFTLYARPAAATTGEWTRHAAGLLAPPAPAGTDGADGTDSSDGTDGLAQWPPPQAETVPVTDLYPRLAERGYDYGPAFRGLRAAWRHGADTYAEVEPEQAADSAADGTADGFLLHPAALDAALHSALAGSPGQDDGTRLVVPFLWSGITLHAPAAGPLRVRLRRDTDDTCSVLIADRTGAPVLRVASLTLRELPQDAGAGGAARGPALLALEWTRRETPRHTPDDVWAVVGPDHAGPAEAVRAAGVTVRGYRGPADLARDLDAGARPPALIITTVPADADADADAGPAADTGSGAGTGSAMAGTAARAGRTGRAVLDLVQHHLADERLEDSRLALLTTGAVALAPGERQDPAAATAWGLVRAVQAERPGRFALADTDGRPESLRALPAVLAAGEPQAAVRTGRMWVPQLRRRPLPADPADRTAPAGSAGPADRAPFDKESHVLITGGLGTLGRLVARHLTERYGVRRLLLTGRRGMDTPGAGEFVAELAAADVEVSVESCDIGDRTALAALLAAVPQDRPLTAVVHAAGVTDDAVAERLTPEHWERTWRPKAAAAAHLHDLTRDTDLSAFVLFSSLAGLLGSAGQANYAAANACLDALAARRRSAGRPALSVAWGLWAEESTLSGGLGEADLRRLARSGIGALSSDEGLALFDAALAAGDPVLAAARLDLDAMDPDTAPAPLRALSPGARRTSAGRPRTEIVDLRGRLARAPRHEHRHLVLEAVRSEVAAVLGHSGHERVSADRRFQDLGFDSLTAVELRNRLVTLAGVTLPPTLIFDHPTPGALADRLHADLAPAAPEPGAPGDAGGGGDEDGDGAGPDPHGPPPGGSALDTMTTDDLVRLALGGSES
ncbi:type I polyketide synthase, partial [Streptomyces sp. YIM 98790]|uniref:type I polyketide synthase n=1 Tax=Streptomyces sp. YIM 98790 TaxID=2689077 RepID=UPI0014073554